MSVVRRSRRGAAGWSVVVDRWRASGLSVEAFCRRDGVSRAGFYRWRSLLAAASSSPSSVPAAKSGAAEFVDLGVLGEGARSDRFELRLDLGAGLVLTLVRG